MMTSRLRALFNWALPTRPARNPAVRRYISAYRLGPRSRPQRRSPRTAEGWAFGRSGLGIPRRLARGLLRPRRARIALEVKAQAWPIYYLARGPALGLSRKGRRRRSHPVDWVWPRRHLPGARSRPRALLRRLPFRVWPSPHRRHRMALVLIRQVGALRARRPRPLAPGVRPSPRPQPGLAKGLTPPSALPAFAPLSVVPRGWDGAKAPLRVMELWQRAWIVGLMLRPQRWARYLRF